MDISRLSPLGCLHDWCWLRHLWPLRHHPDHLPLPPVLLSEIRGIAFRCEFPRSQLLCVCIHSVCAAHV